MGGCPCRSVQTIITKAAASQCPPRLPKVTPGGYSDSHPGTLSLLERVHVEKINSFLGGASGKEPTRQCRMWVGLLGWEDPLEEEMATCSSPHLENPRERGAGRATVHRVAPLDASEVT